jgi:hypothetical protein
MSKQVYSKTIERKPEPEVEVKKDRMLRVAEKRNALVTLADQIARNKTVVYKSYPYPGGAKHFPNEPKLTIVSLYYPHAEGGPLFIDEPMFSHEVESCKRKSVAMTALGHRYCFIGREATIEDVVAQLGE